MENGNRNPQITGFAIRGEEGKNGLKKPMLFDTFLHHLTKTLLEYTINDKVYKGSVDVLCDARKTLFSQWFSMVLADSVAWWMGMREPEKSNMENGTPIRMCYKGGGCGKRNAEFSKTWKSLYPFLSELVPILQFRRLP